MGDHKQFAYIELSLLFLMILIKYGYQSESCDFAGLSMVPDTISDNCTEVILTDHTISNFTYDVLANLPNTTDILRITGGIIDVIESDAFDNISIEELELRNNELMEIPDLGVSVNDALRS